MRNSPAVSQANPVFERIETPGIGSHLAGGATVRAAQVPRQQTSPAPLLATPTDEVLHEALGLDSGAVGRLHDAGVVTGPERAPSARAANPMSNPWRPTASFRRK